MKLTAIIEREGDGYVWVCDKFMGRFDRFFYLSYNLNA